MEQIVILDFGSQYTQVIARRIRECNVYSVILRPRHAGGGHCRAGAQWHHFVRRSVQRVCEKCAVAGQKHFRARPARARHLLRRAIVRAVSRRQGRERPETRIRQRDAHREGRIVRPVRAICRKRCRSGIRTATNLRNCRVNSNQSPSRKIPNMPPSKTARENFSACNSIPKSSTRRGARKSFPILSTASAAAAKTGRCAITLSRRSRKSAPRWAAEKVILGLSGGVDSSVAAALLHKAIGDQLTCIFVNNGLLRGREAEVVREVFGRHFKIKLQYEDASKLFLRRLKGVTEPERKRKIIGKTFIEVFQNAARRAGQAKFLAQGTLYPDVIESVPIDGNPAALIKSHHNVGGLPKKMKFAARRAAEMPVQGRGARSSGLELGLPKEIVLRQPFPGPGLAVRILGEVTPERCEILRNADAIVVEEMKSSGLVLQNLAELRGAAARAQRGRDGRRTDLRLHHRHPRGGIAGRHDGGLGEAALRPCWRNSRAASSTRSRA